MELRIPQDDLQVNLSVKLKAKNSKNWTGNELADYKAGLALLQNELENECMLFVQQFFVDYFKNGRRRSDEEARQIQLAANEMRLRAKLATACG